MTFADINFIDNILIIGIIAYIMNYAINELLIVLIICKYIKL